MQKEPKGLRPHIVLLGRRNVGKSSLINSLTDQPLSLVSSVPGTTTDPVQKAFELLPFGPVIFIDTGGVDDIGELGEMRVKRAMQEFKSADFALLVVEAEEWGEVEDDLMAEIKEKNTRHFVIVNKTDTAPDWKAPVEGAHYISAKSGEGVRELKFAMAEQLEKIASLKHSVLGDLVSGGDLVVLVVPIDLEAPRGRLILPQVMTIRDILDNDATALVVKDRELFATVRSLGIKPKLVICDSQVVLKVAGDLPPDIKMTTFSTLFARQKGDLGTFVRGVKTIDELKDGDRVLIAEACSHHAVADDIGKVKIPRWVRQYTGRDIIFDNVQGRDYPEDLSKYKLVIHCAACMITPKGMHTRMDESLGEGVPITNYGVTISYVQGVLERALEPFGGIDMFLE